MVLRRAWCLVVAVRRPPTEQLESPIEVDCHLSRCHAPHPGGG